MLGGTCLAALAPFACKLDTLPKLAIFLPLKAFQPNIQPAFTLGFPFLYIIALFCHRMRSLLPVSLLVFVFGFSSSIHATTLPFTVRTTPSSSSSLASRAFTSQVQNNNTLPVANVSIPIHNTHNAEYICNITLGGRTIPVLLDTGR